MARDTKKKMTDAAVKKTGSGDADEPSPEPTSPALVALWGVALFFGCRLVEIFLAAQSMAGAVGQAVLVEYGSSRLGVQWSDAREVVTTALIVRRAAIGAAVGLTLSAAVFATIALTRSAEVANVASTEASVLVIGLLTAGLTAWRDELLHHGVVLRALDPPKAGKSVSVAAKVIACGVTSAGAALGRSDASAKTVFVAALLGVVFGALWVRDRGAWQPWAAHTAFRFATSTLLSGGVVLVKVADNSWAGGAAGMLGGTAAAVALAPLAVLAVGLTMRRISPRSSEEG